MPLAGVATTALAVGVGKEGMERRNMHEKKRQGLMTIDHHLDVKISVFATHHHMPYNHY